MKKVIKRSGKKVQYDVDKIIDAIANVFYELDNYNKREVGILAHKVDRNLIINYFGRGDEPHVEQIQDIVEDVLIEEEHKQEAKAYIRYREKHAQRRKEWLKNERTIAIWSRKYQYDGENFEQHFNRVTADNSAARELYKEKVLFGAGRILANRGLYKDGRKVTYSNCYTSVPPKDDLEDIIKVGARMARTFSYGGGTGLTVDNLRPKGAKVNNAAKITSGPVSFLDIYDVISEKVGQKGRRAALMITMIVSHPDILEFIDKKANLKAINKANMSVKLTDKFMKAVEEGRDFKLHFQVSDTDEIIENTVSANKIMNKIAHGNWNVGDPGVLFWDTIKSWSIVSEDEEYLKQLTTTNPCGEKPLPNGGSCLLGSVNLANLVKHPYTNKARFDMDKFTYSVSEGVKFLNQVLEEGLPLHPLEEQRQCVRKWRPIGLGPLGVGSMLIKMGIKYGSTKSIRLIHEIGHAMINAALQQSALLAKEYGPYPKFKKDKVLNSAFIRCNATKKTINLIKKYGLRNNELLAAAPTGSIHQLAEVSSGIEPIFAVNYTRKTESLHQEDKSYEVFQPTVHELMKHKGITNIEDLPNYVVDAQSLNYDKRIEVQAAWQTYIDASISSTINVKNEVTISEMKHLLMQAWRKGLKGVTLFREKCKKAAILENQKSKENRETKTTMQTQDWINQGICPECKDSLVNVGGCTECLSCGFEVCHT